MSEEKLSGLQLLRAPFPLHQISQLPKPTCKTEEWKKLPKGKCKICGGYHATSKTIHLSYVGHAALTDRLLDADPEWTWEPLSFGPDGLPAFDTSGGLWIKLTVCGITRIGYGHAKANTFADIGSREKEVIGDALRNAAMRFGAALELWHKGDLHVDGADSHETENPKSTAPYWVTKIDAECVAAKDFEPWWKKNTVELNNSVIDTTEYKKVETHFASMREIAVKKDVFSMFPTVKGEIDSFLETDSVNSYLATINKDEIGEDGFKLVSDYCVYVVRDMANGVFNGGSK